MCCIWLRTLREVDKEQVFFSSPAFLCTLVIPTLKWSEKTRVCEGGDTENLRSVLPYCIFSNVIYYIIKHLDIVFSFALEESSFDPHDPSFSLLIKCKSPPDDLQWLLLITHTKLHSENHHFILNLHHFDTILTLFSAPFSSKDVG